MSLSKRRLGCSIICLLVFLLASHSQADGEATIKKPVLPPGGFQKKIQTPPESTEEDERIELPAIPMHLSGDKSYFYRRSNRIELMGHAIFHQPGESLGADSITIDNVNRTLTARGNCLYITGDMVIRGDEMHFNLDTRVGTILNGRASNSSYVLTGEWLHRLGQGRFLVFNGAYSTCRDCRQSWAFEGDKIDFEFEGYAFVDNAILKIKDAPVLWIPYFILPIKKNRQTGLLPVEFGFDRINIPFYWAINEWSDALITVGYDGHFNGGLRASLLSQYMLTERSQGVLSAQYQMDRDFASPSPADTSFYDPSLKAPPGLSEVEANRKFRGFVDGRPKMKPHRVALRFDQTQEVISDWVERLSIKTTSDVRVPHEVSKGASEKESVLKSQLLFSNTKSQVTTWVDAPIYQNLIPEQSDPSQFDRNLVQKLPEVGAASNNKFLFGLPISVGASARVAHFTRLGSAFDYDPIRFMDSMPLYEPSAKEHDFGDCGLNSRFVQNIIRSPMEHFENKWFHAAEEVKNKNGGTWPDDYDTQAKRDVQKNKLYNEFMAPVVVDAVDRCKIERGKILNDSDKGYDPRLEYVPGRDPIRKAVRLTVVPRLQTAFRLADVVAVSPSIVYRSYFYKFPDVPSVSDFSRGYGLVQTTYTTQLEKIYKLDDPEKPRLKHIVRPRLKHSIIPFIDEGDVNHPFKRQVDYGQKVYSRGGYHFDSDDLVPLDRDQEALEELMPLGNSLEYGFSTSLIRREGRTIGPDTVYREIATFEADQRLNIREFDKPNSRPITGFKAKLTYQPNDHWEFAAHHAYDPYLEDGYQPWFNGKKHRVSVDGRYFLVRKQTRNQVFEFERSFSGAVEYDNIQSESPLFRVTGGAVFSINDYWLPSFGFRTKFNPAVSAVLSEDGNPTGTEKFVLSSELESISFGIKYQDSSRCWMFAGGIRYDFNDHNSNLLSIQGLSISGTVMINYDGSGFQGVGADSFAL